MLFMRRALQVAAPFVVVLATAYYNRFLAAVSGRAALTGRLLTTAALRERHWQRGCRVVRPLDNASICLRDALQRFQLVADRLDGERSLADSF